MKYKIKMILPNICWLVTCAVFTLLIIILFCLISAPDIFSYLMGVIFYFIAIQIPRRFFQTRLNDYFIIIRWPLSKWKNIYQQPVKQLLRNGNNDFPTLAVAARQMAGLFSLPAFELGSFYRTITHQTIINRLKRLEQEHKIVILACEPAYQKKLKHDLNKLLGGSCLRCLHQKRCRWYRMAQVRRQFYYIEFELDK